MPVMSGQVFVSFSHEHDSGHATWLAGYLASQGLTARYDPQPLTEEWWRTYTKAQIDACAAVVVIMTPQAQASGWVTRELEYAEQQGKSILPLLMRGEPFPSLARYRHEDLTAGGPPGPDFAQRLHAAVGTPPATTHARHVPVQAGRLAASVGIETRGGIFTPLLLAGAEVPCARSESFTTGSDNQESLRVKIFHGTTDRIADAHPIGAYEILLAPAPRGVPQIDVTFQVDSTGPFTLLAKDSTGHRLPITIPSTS